MEQDGIHIIDLNKTGQKLDEATSAVRNFVKSGKKIMFVATKKQAKDIIQEAAKQAGMPFVTERWLGGMLTNFATVRKSIKKMQTIDKMANDGTYANINKKEKLMLEREKAKLISVLGGVADMAKLPSALFFVDVKKEHLAVAEAIKLNIPTIAMVDTNSDPSNIDFAIPANDDSSKSINLIVGEILKAIEEGQMDRKKEKDAVEIEKSKVEKETAEA
jgi:small subunit ribosomal protein S2